MSASFHDCSATVFHIEFRSTTSDEVQIPAPSDAEEPDFKYYFPSPQASITAILTDRNTQKVGVFTRLLSPRMSHRLPVNGSRCLKNTSKRQHQTIELQVLFSATEGVTTLFHSRHAKSRKYTESRLPSTTAQPPYVPSTSGQRQSMSHERRHLLTSYNPTGNSIHRHRKRHNTFSYSPR
jgi:hypothetical protein